MTKKTTYCTIPFDKILEVTKFYKWKTDYWFLGLEVGDKQMWLS